jgi:hypothetical protein
MRMTAVSVEIARFVDDRQPGFVECVLVDADGRSHAFVEKGPVVSASNLLPGSKYPRAGSIACEVISEFTDSSGRQLVRIDTDRPHGVESSSGETKFVVLPSQLVR